MSLPFLLVGVSFFRNPAIFPTLSLDSIIYNGSKVVNLTHDTSEKFYFKSDTSYDEIVLKCTALYAIKWIFLESPIYNSRIQDVNIKTEVMTMTVNNSSSFISFLHLKFYNYTENSMNYNGSIGCQNAISSNSVTWLEMGGKLNLADRMKQITTFRIFRGSKVNSVPKKPGENKNCRTQLVVDEDAGNLECIFKKADNTIESVQHITLRNVSNINEMEALISLKTNCESIIYDRCRGNCITTDTIQSAAVVYCGYGTNSLTMPIFRRNSKLYFDIHKARSHSDLQILEKNSLYWGIPYEFICKGTYSLHMKGFYWTLNRTRDNTYMELGNGVDSFEENNQIRSRINITFDQGGLYTVYCFAPDWSTTTSWSHATTVANVSFEHQDASANSNMEIYDPGQENDTFPNSPGTGIGTSVGTSRTEESANFIKSKEGIIIIAITSSLFIIVISCCAILMIAFRKIQKQSRQLQLITEEEIVEFEKGNPKADTALFLPYNMEFEIPKEQLQIGNTLLGEGNYGIVQKGRYGSLPVAVKTVKKSANGLYFKSLLSELKIMSYVGRHINIVHLVGACTKDLRKGYVCLVYEFCANGNMQQFLKKSRKTFGEKSNSLRGRTLEPPKDQRKSRLTSWVETTNTSAETLTMKDLVLWSQQIASGMEYLSSKNIIHGDLAARNVLITDKMHAKLADFGLSKQLFDYSIYIQKQHCPLPLKWMAPESLRDMEFSVQSDVWSYGVTLWEIYSLGEIPYPGVDWNYESWKMLCDGFRMERPRYASSVLFKMILECWKKEPNERPTFKFLKDYFGEELQQLLLMSNRVFEKLWL